MNRPSPLNVRRGSVGHVPDGWSGEAWAPESNVPLTQRTWWKPPLGFENVTVSPRSTVTFAGVNVNASVVRTGWSAADAADGSAAAAIVAMRTARTRTPRPYPSTAGRGRFRAGARPRASPRRHLGPHAGAPPRGGPRRPRPDHLAHARRRDRRLGHGG